jgi:hypothetical protein
MAAGLRLQTTLVDAAMPTITRGLFRAREIWIDDALCRAARCRRVALRQRRVAAFVIVGPSGVHMQANRISRIVCLGRSRCRRQNRRGRQNRQSRSAHQSLLRDMRRSRGLAIGGGRVRHAPIVARNRLSGKTELCVNDLRRHSEARGWALASPGTSRSRPPQPANSHQRRYRAQARACSSAMGSNVSDDEPSAYTKIFLSALLWASRNLIPTKRNLIPWLCWCGRGARGQRRRRQQAPPAH